MAEEKWAENYRYEGTKAPTDRSQFLSDFDFSGISLGSPSSTTTVDWSKLLNSTSSSTFSDMFNKSLQEADRLKTGTIDIGKLELEGLLNPFYKGNRANATLGQQQNFRKAVSKSKLGTGSLEIPLSAPTAPRL
jgi:hypothetical protein